MSIAALLDHFRRFLSESQLSHVSVKNYVSDTKRFFDWCETNNVSFNSASEIPPYFSKYTQNLELNGTPSKTIARHSASLRRLTTFLESQYNLNKNQVEVNIPQIVSLTPATELKSNTNDLSNILSLFKNYLQKENKSHSTIKNYLSDVNHFISWSANYPHLNQLPLNDLFSKNNINAYENYLQLCQTATSVIRRHQSSLKKFTSFAINQKLIKVDPFRKEFKVNKLLPLSWFKRFSSQSPLQDSHLSKVTKLYRQYHSLPFTPYLHLSLLVIFTTALGIFGYNQVIRQANPSSAYPSTLKAPTRQLSFQGRLTSSDGVTPIATPTQVTFKLYNASASGTLLYNSGTCSVSPDQNGIFNTFIGDGTCGQEIDGNVFTENTAVFLEVSVGAETLSPRQQIATVAYAINAETLQGYPASASAVENTIPVMNSLGDIVLGSSNPNIQSTSGTFSLDGRALTLSTTVDGGDISLAPNGTGQILGIGGTTTEDLLRITNANLTSGSLISGYVGNNTATGNLLRLSSGSTEIDRFLVDTLGNLHHTGNLQTDGAATISGSLRVASNNFIINSSGVITAGTWNGAIIPSQYGGTGANNSSASQYSIPYYNNTGILGGSLNPGSSGYVLVTNSTSSAPSWVDPETLGLNYWQLNSNALSPKNSTYSLNIGNTASNSAYFHVPGTNNQDAWFNLGTGNIGMGTTSPLDKLHIKVGTDQNIRFGSTSSNSFIASYNDINSSLTNLRLYGSNIILNGDTGGNVGIGVTSPTAKLDVSGNINVAGYATVSASLAVGYSNAPTSPGGAIFAGNLGIGLTNPTYKLDVVGDVNLTGALRTSGNAGTSGQLLTSTGTGLAWIDQSSVSGVQYWQLNSGALTPLNITNSLNLGATATSSALVHLAGTASENSFINTGNLGIGTTSPTRKLEISTSLSGERTLAQLTNLNATENDATVIRFVNSSNPDTSYTGRGDIGVIRNAANGGDMFFRTSDGSTDTFERMRITSAGNVGIGTTSPNQKVEIANDNNTSLYLHRLTTNTNDYSELTFGISTSNYYHAAIRGIRSSVDNGALGFFTTTGSSSYSNLAERMRIDPNGNVGIGLTNPSALLDVAGNLNISGAATIAGTTTLNNLTYSWPISQMAGYLLQTDGSGELTWVSPTSFSTGSENYWQRILGNLTPNVLTDPINLGNTATISATVHLAGAPGDNSFINTGYFGIGTTSPTVALTVKTASVGAELLQRWQVADDSSSLLQIMNGNSSDTAFAPVIYGRYATDDSKSALKLVGEIDTDSNLEPIISLVARKYNTQNVSTRPIFDIKENSTSRFMIDADGRVSINDLDPNPYTTQRGVLNVVSSSTNSNLARSANDSLKDPDYYHLVLRYDDTTNNSNEGPGLAFTSDQNTVGGAIVFNRTGTYSQGELNFYTKQNTVQNGTPSLVMSLTDAGAVNLTTGVLNSQVSNSSSAVGFTFNTSSNLSNATAKLLSVTNNGSEKMYLDGSGNLYVSGAVTANSGFTVALVNKTGTTIAKRSLVTTDNDNNSSFITTTTRYDVSAFGVVVGIEANGDVDGDGNCDANDTCLVALSGEVEVLLQNASSANRGDYVFTSETAGQGLASPYFYSGLVGIVSNNAGAASGYVKVVLKAQNQAAGLSVTNNGTVANGSYIDLVHNQDTNDVVVTGWYYDTNTSQWKVADSYSQTYTQNLKNQFDDALTSYKIRTQTDTTSIGMAQTINTGTGADGAITVSSNTNINTTAIASGRSCADAAMYSVSAIGTNYATVTSAPSSSCLKAGDEILLINLQGTSASVANLGNNETLTISSISSSTIYFTTSVTKYYGDGDNQSNLGTGTGNQKVMLQRVPHYTNVTVNSGITLYPSSYSYTAGTGGVLFFRVSGTLSVAGYLSTVGSGYAGGSASGGAFGNSQAGQGAFYVSTSYGYGGAGGYPGGNGGNGYFCGGGGAGVCTGCKGTSGAASSTAGAWGGGGGGSGDNNGYGGTKGGAGGGGGGANPGNGGGGYYTGGAGSSSSSGAGGAGYAPCSTCDAFGGTGGGGKSDPSLADSAGERLLFGGGGGGGGGGMNNSFNQFAGGAGGSGGGIIAVEAKTVSVSGAIAAYGGAGGSGSYNGAGGGGGGGGTIRIKGESLTLGSSIVNANGNSGGGGSYTGGTGGAGRVAIQYVTSISGTTTPSANVTASGYNPYGIYHSKAIPTQDATALDKIYWEATSSAYGRISFQTRSGNSANPTDGTWEAWKPASSSANYVTLQDMNTHTNWTGTNLTVADGDVTRSGITNFEDEAEATASSTTKMTSSTNGGYAESTISSTNISSYDYVTLWVRASQSGTTLRVGLGESAATEQTEDIKIDAAGTWQKVYWDLSDITSTSRDAITKLRITNLSGSSNTIYVDNIKAEKLLNNANGGQITSTPNNYIQYRAIFTTTNTAYQPTLENVSLIYNSGFKTVQIDSDTIRLYNYSGSTQSLRLDAVTGGIGQNSGVVSLAPIAADVDTNSSTNSIWINKTGSGGNLAKLQVNGSDKFTIDTNGNVNITGNYYVNGVAITAGGGSSVWSTNGSSAYYNTGFVGIGTSTPTTYLQLAGTTDTSLTTDGLAVFGATNSANISIDQNEIMARNNGSISTLYIQNEGGDTIINGNGTSGNIGIGTTTPSDKLSVLGNLNLMGAATISGTLKLNGITYTWPSSQTNGYILSTNGSGTLSWTNPSTLGTNYWQLNSGALTPLNITNSLNLGATATSSALVHLAGTASENSFINTGNLGIGTTSPTTTLQVVGTSTMRTILPETDATYDLGATSSARFRNAYLSGALHAGGSLILSDGEIFQDNGSLNLSYTNTSGSKQIGFTLLNTGRIGIGTTSPSSALDVVGDINLTGTLKTNGGAGSNGQVLTSTGTGTAWTSVSNLSVGNADTLDTLDSLQFLRSDTSDSYTSGTLAFDSGTTLDINGDISIADTNIALDGATTNLTATGDLSINTNNLFVQKSTGNVGIGTTSPTSLLSIGSTNITANPQIAVGTDTTASNYALSVSGGRAMFGYDNSGGAAVIGSGGSKGLEIFVNGSNNSWMSGTQALTILGNGNVGYVGIGITNPGSKLDVKGTLRLSGATSGYVGFAPAAAAGSTTYTLPSADGSNGYVLTTDGSGTLSWVAQGGGTNYWALTSNSLSPINNTYALNVGNSASTSAIFHVPGTTNQNSWFNLGTGNLGIGLTNPTYKLDVVGDVNLTGALRINGSAGTSGQILSSTGTGLAWIDASTNGTNYWQLNSGALTPLNITNSLNLGATATSSALVHLAGTASENSFINTGNLGIGTTSPNYKFEVANTASPVTIGATLLGNPGTNSTFGTLNFRAQNTTGTPTWTTAFTGYDQTTFGFAYDSIHNVLYATTGWYEEIYRCDLSTGCDQQSDWTLSLEINSWDGTFDMAFDETNGVLYAGVDNYLYRCDTSTNCDATGDWTLVYTYPNASENAFGVTIDQTNHVLYTGNDYQDKIYRCDIAATSCDQSSDFTVISTGSDNSVDSITWDSTNNVLYAGKSWSGHLLRCSTSSGCDASGDWTSITLPQESSIFTSTIDTTNQVLYVGSGDAVLRCPLSSGCDAAGDFTEVFTVASTYIQTSTFDVDNGVIYVGTGDDASTARIYQCSVSSGCDASGDWSLAYTSTEGTGSYIGVLYAIDGTVYAGELFSGKILRYQNTSSATYANYAQINASAITTTSGSEDGRLTLGTLVSGSFNNTLNISLGNVGVGTTSPSHKLDVNGNIGLAASSYINFGSTDGSDGYGIRDNAGTVEYKSSGGSWAAIGSGGGGSSAPVSYTKALVNANPSVSVTNSSAATAVYTYTIPGGTLAGGKNIRVYAKGSFTNNSGTTRTITIGANYGGSQIAKSVSGNFATSATAGQWQISFDMGNTDSSSKQRGEMFGQFLSGTAARVAPTDTSGTTSINSNNDQDLVITIQMSAAASTITTTLDNISIELLGATDNFGSQWTTTGSNIYYNTGNVGIGLTNPAYKLNVIGTSGLGVLNIASSSGTSLLNIAASGNVGIGTTSPNELLHVSSPSNSAFAKIQAVTGSGKEAGLILQRGTSTDEYTDYGLISSGSDLYLIQSESGSDNTVLFVDNNRNIGIGTTTPATKLSVGGAIFSEVTSGANYVLNSSGSYAGFLGTNSSDSWYLGYGSSSPGTSVLTWNTSGNVGIGTTTPGANRLNVVAPSGSNAIQASTSNANDWAIVSSTAGNGIYSYSSSTTAMAINCQSSNSNGCGGNRAWYNYSDARLKENIETIPNALDTVMHLRGVNFNWIDGGQADTGFIAQEVLPYFPQVVGQDPTTGIYGLKTGSLTGLTVEAIKEQQGQIDQAFTKISATSSQLIAQNDYLESKEITAQTANFEFVNIAGQSLYNYIVAVIDQVRPQTNLLNPIAEVALETATISGTLYANNIQSPTVDQINSNIHELVADNASAAAIIADIQSRYSTYDQLLNPTNTTDPLDTSSLSTLNATISADMTINSLTASSFISTSDLLTNSINSSLDSDLYIQPLATNALHLLGDTMTLYPDGHIIVNADIFVNGSIIAQNITTQTATISGFGKLLAFYNESGDLVASIDSSGSADFQQVITKQLIIASGASQSASITTNSNSNTSIGTATIASGSSEIAITNTTIANNTLIYLTPISDTQNQVLYVKSKQEGAGFTVAINNPISTDIQFNYWLIKIQ